MAIPRPPKKFETLPSVRASQGLYIAVVQFLAVRNDPKFTFGEMCRQALALYITGDALHDFDSQSTVIVGADKVFRNSELDQQSYVVHGTTGRERVR